jgi:hypothetical protein
MQFTTGMMNAFAGTVLKLFMNRFIQVYCPIAPSFLSQHETHFQQLFIPCHYAMSVMWMLAIFLPEFSLQNHLKFKPSMPKTTLHFLLHHEQHHVI